MGEKTAMSEIPDITDRERLIIQAAANLAADLAVERMNTTFYAGVGKFAINRMLVLVGAAIVGFAFARGWVKF